ncbi:hypothetical protein [Rubrivirga sp. IMCC45206]|uniref:hypothetical protein n=1 Tax=Rubrivirga sp. IMCC45206 TaxID=3391614 RepID=UPI00399002E2
MADRLYSRSLFRLSVLLAVAGVALPGCVEFQQVSLYSGVEQAPVPERPRKLSLAVEPMIFADQNDDTIWFEEEIGCTQGRLTEDVVYSGNRAVEVTWSRDAEGCTWAGLGFGWDGWAGKDLSEVLPYAAVQMRVRAKEGRMFGLPIVLTLEDYSGGMGFAYTDNKYFERTFIDEEWQTVTVPLKDFDLDIESLDATNVKQLMFELQQSGSIYVDDIELIYYDAPPQEPWLVEAPRPDPTALPIQLFGDAFINDNGWGLVTDACQSIAITEADATQGTSALHIRWDLAPDTCYEAAMGVSWDKWYPVDATSIASTAAVRFDVRLASGTASRLPIRVALEDYARQTSQIILDGRFVAGGGFSTEWQTVTIPFTELRGGGRELAAAPATVGDAAQFGDGADLGSLKQLVFYFDESGEVFIDNLRLVSVR